MKLRFALPSPSPLAPLELDFRAELEPGTRKTHNIQLQRLFRPHFFKYWKGAGVVLTSLCCAKREQLIAGVVPLALFSGVPFVKLELPTLAVGDELELAFENRSDKPVTYHMQLCGVTLKN